MTEEYKNDKYIICSGCTCKYINDEEHISNDFGYTRLEMRYKTCVRCRVRSKIKNKTYQEKHPEKSEKAKEHYEANKDYLKEQNKQYRENNADRLKEYDRARNQIKINCPNCNCEIVKRKLNSHLQTQKCKSYVKPIEKPQPNDNYIIVGGRVYLKGESPLEGVWHADHTPFEVNRYVIFENGVERGVTITKI